MREKSNLPGWRGVMARRLIDASAYSWMGLKAGYQQEEAFRIQLWLALFLIPTAIWLAGSQVELVLLIGSVVLVLIVEILNSAVEAVVDRISLEEHELLGRAKDYGSTAVILSMGLFLMTWFCLLVVD